MTDVCIVKRCLFFCCSSASMLLFAARPEILALQASRAAMNSSNLFSLCSALLSSLSRPSLFCFFSDSLASSCCSAVGLTQSQVKSCPAPRIACPGPAGRGTVLRPLGYADYNAQRDSTMRHLHLSRGQCQLPLPERCKTVRECWSWWAT